MSFSQVVGIYRLKSRLYAFMLEEGFSFYRLDSEGRWYIHPETGLTIYLSKK